MSALRDISGLRFGQLVVLGIASRKPVKWACSCDCGGRSDVRTGELTSGKTNSCGCLRHRRDPDGKKLHPLYGIWCGIKSRCENPNRKQFTRYGGAGINVCPRWRSDFWAFVADMGDRPSPDHSIDRIDNEGDYEPGNCRWATHIEQANNRRRTRMVVYRGHEMPLTDAVREAGSVIHYEAAWVRIRTGWAVERALETPRLHVSGNAKFRKAPVADNDWLKPDRSVA